MMYDTYGETGTARDDCGPMRQLLNLYEETEVKDKKFSYERDKYWLSASERSTQRTHS
jgi:hypothetical protein